MSDNCKTRLHVEAPLSKGAVVTLTEPQANYVLRTLRMREGEKLALFNGSDGEWEAEITAVAKREAQVTEHNQRAPQKNAPDTWLVFAPVKNEKIDYTVKRAVELGVNALLPVMTRRTAVSRVNVERLQANAVEAAQQSGRMDVPRVEQPVKLEQLLGGWPANRRLIWCDETGSGKNVREALPTLPKGPAAVLIGPEGGFAPEEINLLQKVQFGLALSLGPRILRAETAALAALANVQAWLGDWDEKPDFKG